MTRRRDGVNGTGTSKSGPKCAEPVFLAGEEAFCTVAASSICERRAHTGRSRIHPAGSPPAARPDPSTRLWPPTGAAQRHQTRRRPTGWSTPRPLEPHELI